MSEGLIGAFVFVGAVVAGLALAYARGQHRARRDAALRTFVRREMDAARAARAAPDAGDPVFRAAIDSRVLPPVETGRR